jgi:DNA-binding FadR family transcriptional regulator
MSWDKIIHEHEQIAQVIREKDCTLIDKAINEHLSKAFVDMVTVQHPEYFKQNVQEYLL